MIRRPLPPCVVRRPLGVPNGMAILREGDCRVVLSTLAANSVDSIVTDPPYHIGFMGKKWDSGDVAFDPATWAAVLRVLKPGGHMLVFGGTRTYHRMACAIEDAGFEIRDQIGWMYGQGFPKSHDVSKAIDKQAGAEGSFGEPKSVAHAGWIERGRMRGDQNEAGWQRPWMDDPEQVSNAAREYIPATNEGQQWQGWGTALKPAWEPIVLARKPFDGSVATNVLRNGTGALNIDGCRIQINTQVDDPRLGGAGTWGTSKMAKNTYGVYAGSTVSSSADGRWPANVIHDGSDEVMEAFAVFGTKTSGVVKPGTRRNSKGFSGIGDSGLDKPILLTGFGDTGTAARFFYCAKASTKERNGRKHPTIKPIALMRYLCRLITPPNGVVLDPFAGTGTTGAAALAEGFRAILIENEAEYCNDIRKRLGLGAGSVHSKGVDRYVVQNADPSLVIG